jgi:hypothetical protein
VNRHSDRDDDGLTPEQADLVARAVAAAAPGSSKEEIIAELRECGM